MLAAYLAAGFVASVTVAWAFALWDRTDGPYNWITRENRSGEERTITGTQLYLVVNPRFALSCFRPDVDNACWTSDWLNSALRYDIATSTRKSQFEQPYDGRVYEASGWPMLAFWCQYGPDFDATRKATAAHGAVCAPLDNRVRGIWAATPVGLPIRTIWPGLLTDTLFFGCCSWAAWNGPRSIRAFRRRGANLCRHCSYDLRGLPPAAPCPECGAG